MAGNSSKHIIQSLVVNMLITVSKGFAAFVTSSGAMLAETIHSFADCANQALLLLGLKQSKRPPNKQHPLGYGRAVYFWSFMVAMLLFAIGGMFSIYEGIHKIQHPQVVEHIQWAIGVLAFSILLEAFATYSNILELNKRRGSTGFFQYLRSTKDSDLVVVFGENTAAVLGLILALIAVVTAYLTGDGKWDGYGSLAIGIVLVLVAIFLAVEVKSLLIGESADTVINHSVEELVKNHHEIEELINCITIQQGPGEVLMCVKIKCKKHLSAGEISKLINIFEAGIRSKNPEVKWLYIEPDLQEWKQEIGVV